MAVIASSFSTSSVSALIRDTDVDTTPELDVVPGGGAGNIQQVFIDNKANTTDFYLYFWNQTHGMAFGSTAPHTVLFCPAGKSKHYVFPRSLVFGTAISFAGATNFAAGSFTPVDPSSNVAVGIYISA